MIKRGHLNVPVIGVAKAGWTLDQFKARAYCSLEKHGGIDPAVVEKLSALLGTSTETTMTPTTFQALARELKGTHRQAHYLAVPPSSFETAVAGLVKCSSCMAEPRIILEKPFGRSGIGAAPEPGSAAAFR